MPRIIKDSTEESNSTTKPFVKKKYRPWDLLDEGDFYVVTAQNDNQKQHTNQTQNERKANTQPNTNSVQIEHKVPTQNSSEKSTEHGPDTQPNTIVNTKLVQNEYKPDTYISLFELVGLQKKITLLVYELCKNNRSTVSEPLTLEHISEHLNIKIGSIKTTIARLEEKKILIRKEFKNGRGGWTKYELPKSIYNEALQLETAHKQHTNDTQTRHKPDTQPSTQLNTTSPSSSSFNNYITTTTETVKSQKINLNDDWLNVDIEPLKNIGFTKTHLEQLASQNLLLPKIVQDSIYAFSFDLVENNKAKELKGQPINFFMGILRKGNPYASPVNYESPQDKSMRIYVEQQRAIEAKRAAIEKEAFELAFNEWFKGLSEEEKKQYTPKFLTYTEGHKPTESIARKHFSDEIWAVKLNAILEVK